MDMVILTYNILLIVPSYTEIRSSYSFSVLLGHHFIGPFALIMLI